MLVVLVVELVEEGARGTELACEVMQGTLFMPGNAVAVAERPNEAVVTTTAAGLLVLMMTLPSGTLLAKRDLIRDDDGGGPVELPPPVGELVSPTL